MSENEIPELKPDPAATRRRISVPLVAGAAVLVVVAAGATYAITTGNLGADDPALSAAHASSEVTESASSSSRSSSSAPQTSTPAPTAPGLLTGVPVAPTTSAVPASVASASPRGASASRVNQYAPTTSSYVRTTAVQSTTVALPSEVVAAMDAPDSTTTTVPTAARPAGQGGALVGGTERGEDDEDLATPVEPRPVSGGGSPEQSVRDVAGTPVKDEPARPAGEQESMPEPSTPTPTPTPPAVAAPSAPVSAPASPAPVQEPVQVAELDAAFRSAFAPGASDGQLAAAFESGPAMIPVGRALADGLPLLGGAVQWSLAGVAGVGDLATGQLVITTPLGTNVVSMVWVRHGEQWKIATESTCALGLALLGGCAGA